MTTQTTQVTQTARNATAIAISTLLARGIQFAWVIALAQLLGADNFGIYGTIGGMVAIAAACIDTGSSLIILRDVAQQPERGRPYLSAALVLHIALAMLSYLGLIIVGLALPYDTAFRSLLALAAINLFLDMVGNLGHVQLLAIEKMVVTSTIMVIHLAALVLFAGFAVVSGGGLVGLYVGTLAAGLVRAGLYWAALLRRHIALSERPQREVVIKLIRDGWPITLAALLRLAYQHIDKVIAKILIGNVAAGYLTAAFTIIWGVVELLNTTVLTAVFPAMSRLTERDSVLRTLVDRLAFLTLVITLPLGVGLSLLAQYISALLFPNFKGTAAVLEVMIWYAVVMMVGNIYAQYLLVRGRQTSWMVIRAIGLVVNIVLNLILMPLIGVTGAAYAALTTECVVLAVLLFNYHLDLKTWAELGSSVLKAALSALAMALCILLLRDVSWIVAGIASMVVYTAAIIVLRTLSQDDWGIIRGAADSLPVIGRTIGRFLAVLSGA